MRLIREYRTGRLNTRVYGSKAVRDAETAARFIAGAAALEEFHAKYIALRDTEHSPDEGNGSRQLRPDAPAEEIRQALAEGSCARLYLSGRYGRANAGIGVDLGNYELSVTLSAGQAERTEKLAAALEKLL